MNFNTGNAIVDQLATINISGNVIPHAWYSTLKKEKTNKPYLHAIVILADIVYWYRPEEKRNLETGQFMGYKKRFKADLLQRRYKYFSEMFGISEKECQRALVFLEKKNIIKRVFRKITNDGKTLNNVMFLWLNVDELKKITFPSLGDKEIKEDAKENVKENVKEGSKIVDKNNSDENKKNSSNKQNKSLNKSETNDLSTKLSTKNSVNIPMDKNVHTLWTNSSTPYGQKCPYKYKEYNTKDYYTDQSDQSKDKRNNFDMIMNVLKEQIEYNILEERMGENKEILENIFYIMLDVLTSKEDNVKINKQSKPIQVVQSVFRKINMLDVQEVIWKIEKYQKPITNPKAFIVTLLYNQRISGDLEYKNNYNCRGE